MLEHSTATRPLPAISRRKFIAFLLWSPVWIFFLTLGGNPLWAATPEGTIIRNQAAAAVGIVGQQIVFPSNTVEILVEKPKPPPSQSQVAFCRIDPAATETGTILPVKYKSATGEYVATDVPPPPSVGATDPTQPLHFAKTTAVRSGEYILICVHDKDQNLYVHDIETVTVQVSNGDGTDIEELQLSETGPDTGVFAGYLLANNDEPHAHDGRISSRVNSHISVKYFDVSDASDHTTSDVLIDPFGTVFDSNTGEALDGVSITMIDDSTGKPATVYGSDGVSAYPSTLKTGEVVKDSSGRLYTPPPGGYAFPLVKPGRYHYSISLDPTTGYSFPSVATAAELAALPQGPFALSSASTGGSFDVVDVPVKVDLPADPSDTALSLTLTTPTTTAAVGDFVKFDLDLTSRRSLHAFSNVLVADVLPSGFHLEASSVRVDNERFGATLTPDGRSFVLTIPSLTVAHPVNISYLARVVSTKEGRLINSAMASSGRIHSARASASVLIRDELQANRAHLLGRVVRWENGHATTEGIPSVAIYLETGTFSVTDARGFFRFEGLPPGTHVAQLDTTTLPEGAKLILPHDSTEASGNARSRFVDLAAGSLRDIEFFAELPAAVVSKAATPKPVEAPKAEFDQAWINAESDSFDWLLPDPANPPSVPAVKILIKHNPVHKLKVFLNGEPVSGLNFEGTLRSQKKNLAASLWRGVNIKEGENVFEVVREDSFGIERKRERRTIYYASPPVRAELVPEASQLIADGVTAPVAAFRLYDRKDRPARAGTSGHFAVHEPHAVFQEEKVDLRLTPGALPPEPKFTVEKDGLVRIKLRPVATSGPVHITLGLADGEYDVHADLVGNRSDWLLVGLAEGTAGYRTISGHLENAKADELDQGSDESGRVAFFAKGRIRGHWLLTAAYDSSKQRPSSKSLYGKIDPDAYYTVYGDQSERLEGAPSFSKLYIKLERDAVTALFGDFNLDWSSTAFTTYGRDLHGAKVEYNKKKIRASAFQSDAGLTSSRDEIPGSGLSGPYQLSHHPIVGFSEKIVIQERDRMRPSVVLAERPLSHNLDYTIDYQSGVVRLSQPLFPNSTQLNPQYLVARYELEDTTAGVVQGARVEYRPTEKTGIGASHIREEHSGKPKSMTGVDAHVALSKSLTLQAEVAQSNNDAGSSQAYRTELNHRTKATDTRIYFKETGVGFGLGQLDTPTLGNRQVGFEGAQQLGKNLSARETIEQETIVSTGDRRETGEAQLEWNKGAWSYRTGVRAASDLRSGKSEESLLGTTGITRRLLNDRLEVRFDHEQSLMGEAENADFPTRTVIGATYKITPATSLVAEQEWTSAKARDTAVTRLGLKTTPWTGGTLTSGVTESLSGVSSTTLGSGLNQTIPISPDLSLEGGLERSQVFGGKTEAGGAGAVSSTPFHSAGGFSSAAQGDSSSIFAGAHWKPGEVLYNSRIEFNDTAGSQRTGLLASAQSEPGQDLGLLGSVSAYRQTSTTAAATFAVDVRLGAAWRPAHGSTIILHRLDLVRTPGSSGDFANDVWKFVENVHVNQRLGETWEGSLHLGAKYVMASYENHPLNSITTLLGTELRHNLSAKWDVGATGAALSNWDVGNHKLSMGVSVGRTLAKNLWVSVGYNFSGFVDTDFTAARYTARGFYFRFRMKFDQESLSGLIHIIKEE